LWLIIAKHSEKIINNNKKYLDNSFYNKYLTQGASTNEPKKLLQKIMKNVKLLFSIYVISSVLFLSCGKNNEGTMNTQQNNKSESTVYICTGPQSKRYHKDSSCNGLNKCSGSVIPISSNDASAQGRTPCKMCY